MNDKLYTEQEMKIIILENNQSHLFKSIDKLDSKFDTLKYWIIGMMIVQFGLILTTLYMKGG